MLACAPGLKDPVSTTQLAKAITFATAILFRLTGRVFPGECPRTVRPCFADGGGCGSGQGWLQWPLGGWSFWVWDQAAQGWSFPSLPYRIDGEWYNQWMDGGACEGSCNLPSVTLPSPVANVTEVVIDGEILDPSAYKVEGYERLVRVDGHHWPCVQNRHRDSSPYVGVNDGSKKNTWQITYTYGRGPGLDGEIACATYAAEIAKWLCNADDCQLPQRVKHISREGVELDFMDPLTFIKEGETGVYLVDLWIHSINPRKLPHRAKISRMDRRPQYRGHLS